MNRADILRIAQEAGIWVQGFPTDHVERFAALVLAAESERLASERSAIVRQTGCTCGIASPDYCEVHAA